LGEIKLKKYVDNFYIKISDEELSALPQIEPIPYDERVVARIRERYSVNDELAILRQRETKPDEFLAYNSFAEAVKGEERS